MASRAWMVGFCLTLTALALTVLAGPALADGCNLKMLASVPLTPLGPGGRTVVPVTINGVDKKMLLDTAGGLTTLNQNTVQALGLHTLESRVKLLSGSGNATRRYVHVDKFRIGTLEGGLDVMVSPDAAPNAPFDGVLAGDLMSRYDVEMDFAAGKLNYFTPNDCNDNVVYWPAASAAVVPIKLGQPQRIGVAGGPIIRGNPFDAHIRVPVILDGKNFDAVVNTGAPNSTLNADVARRVFDITADSPGSAPLGAAGQDPKNKIFGHVFGSLIFAGVSVSAPHIVIRPNLIGSKDPDNDLMTGSNAIHVDDGLGAELTIGMDVLRKLHLYIAYKDRKLYVTPAAVPEATPGKS